MSPFFQRQQQTAGLRRLQSEQLSFGGLWVVKSGEGPYEVGLKFKYHSCHLLPLKMFYFQQGKQRWKRNGRHSGKKRLQERPFMHGWTQHCGF